MLLRLGETRLRPTQLLNLYLCPVQCGGAGLISISNFTSTLANFRGYNRCGKIKIFMRQAIHILKKSYEKCEMDVILGPLPWGDQRDSDLSSIKHQSRHDDAFPFHSPVNLGEAGEADLNIAIQMLLIIRLVSTLHRSRSTQNMINTC